MQTDKNSFHKEVVELLFGHHEIEVTFHKCYEYMKRFFPIDELHLTYYDAESRQIKLIVLATAAGAKRTNMVVPFSKQELDFVLAPNTPAAHIYNTEKVLPSVVRHNRKWRGYWLMGLHLRKGDLFGMVSVHAKAVKPYTPEHLKLFSILKTPFTSFLYDIIRSDNLTQLKNSRINEVRATQMQEQQNSENNIIGAESGLRQVMEMARQVALFDSPVILLGETGAGKEMIAKFIHYLSPRNNGPFVPVNCGAVPETLIDSELFGHEKGAFTGATSSKKGIFESANKGTVFLDEIGELPLNAQVRMLRVLQEKTIQPVGSVKRVNVDIRIIAATHQNLDEMIRNGRFRSDLWFRLHVFTIMIPPLRERKSDIPLLVDYFLEKKSKQMRIPMPLPADADAIAPLLEYDWPGNVRELENVVERALILSRGRPMSFHSIVRGDESLSLIQPEASTKESLNLNHVISKHIRKVLKQCEGKINGPGGAAEMLGIHPGTLRARMDKLGISYGKKKS